MEIVLVFVNGEKRLARLVKLYSWSMCTNIGLPEEKYEMLNIFQSVKHFQDYYGDLNLDIKHLEIYGVLEFPM